MRWLAASIESPRVRTYFALWPITLGDETRWLEWVTVRERWVSYGDLGGDCWDPYEFVDPEPEGSSDAR